MAQLLLITQKIRTGKTKPPVFFLKMFALMKEMRAAPAASAGIKKKKKVINYILKIKKDSMEDECMPYWATACNLLNLLLLSIFPSCVTGVHAHMLTWSSSALDRPGGISTVQPSQDLGTQPEGLT